MPSETQSHCPVVLKTKLHINRSSTFSTDCEHTEFLSTMVTAFTSSAKVFEEESQKTLLITYVTENLLYKLLSNFAQEQ